MKLQQSVAPCNLNISPVVKKLELCHQENNKRSGFIEIPMLDSSRKARDTKLIAGNIVKCNQLLTHYCNQLLTHLRPIKS